MIRRFFQRETLASQAGCNRTRMGPFCFTMEPTIPSSDTVPALTQVGMWESVHEAHEHALVLLAAGVECSVHGGPGGYGLFTTVDEAALATDELRLYALEKHDHLSGPAPGPADYPAGFHWLACWILILSTVFLKQMADPSMAGRFSNSTVGLLAQGEWWRPFTALFLHGDLPHLLGNILIGGLFCLMVAKSLGAWRAWVLILAGGTLGNLVNALFHHDQPFSSIGASTATFAALGLLVGLALSAAAVERRQRLKGLLVPFIAGLLLFGMFGVSGELTDVGGHVWGSLCGVFLGAAAGWWQRSTSAGNRTGSTLAYGGACARHHHLG